MTQEEPGSTTIFLDGTYIDPNADWNHTWAGGADGEEGAPIVWRSLNPRGAILAGFNAGTPEDPDYRAGIQPQGNSYRTYRGFTVQHQACIRGTDNGDGTFSGDYILFEDLDVIEGGPQGTDTTLNWGIGVTNTEHSEVRNCRFAGALAWPGSDNSGGLECFNSRHCIFEFNDVDGTNLYSTFGTKAGNCNGNIWRYNIARAGSIAFYMKSNTGETLNCDDQQFYGNLILPHSDYAFKGNARQNRSKIFNNTAIGCPRFYSMWKLNSTLIELYNNIFAGTSDAWLYEVEELGGASPDFSPYISKANYNCARNLRASPITWGFGGSTMTWANWIANQTSVIGHDANSTSSDPLFTNEAGGDYTLQAGSPCRNAGEGGIDMGYTGVTSRVGTDWA